MSGQTKKPRPDNQVDQGTACDTPMNSDTKAVNVIVNVNVNNFLAISIWDFDNLNSREPGPQAKGVHQLETSLRQLHVTHRASSCAKRGGNVQLCSKPRGARRIEPETFRRRGHLLSYPPTSGLCSLYGNTQPTSTQGTTCNSKFRQTNSHTYTGRHSFDTSTQCNAS